jgi:hypothetical protein
MTWAAVSSLRGCETNLVGSGAEEPALEQTALRFGCVCSGPSTEDTECGSLAAWRDPSGPLCGEIVPEQWLCSLPLWRGSAREVILDPQQEVVGQGKPTRHTAHFLDATDTELL